MDVNPYESPRSVQTVRQDPQPVAFSTQIVAGGMAWSAIATAIALPDPNTREFLWAYALGGALTGLLAGGCGWLLGRRGWWRPAFNLPIGGAVATFIPLGIFGAALGYSFAAEPGGGKTAYVLQGVFGMFCAGFFGAAFGALMGFVTIPIAYAIHWVKRILRVRASS
jgi:hypothetical protein